MGCCKGAEYGNWCDGVEIVWKDPETHKEYCLFHAPAERKIEYETVFNERLDEIIHDSIKNKDSCCLISGAIIPSEIVLSNFTFFSLSFEDTVFKKNVTIENITIENYLEAPGARFESNLKFKNCGALGSLFLDNTLISTTLSVIDCDEIRGISLQSDTLPQELIIGSNVLGGLDVSSRYSHPSININIYIKTHSPSCYLKFKNITIQSLTPSCSFLSPVTFTNCTFHVLKLNNFDFIKGCFFTNCKFDKLYLAPSQVDSIDFFSCQFPHLKKRVITSDAFSTKFPDVLYRDAYCEELYRKLKQKMQHEENRRLASDWHYWEKYFCEKRLFTEGTFFEWFILWAYRNLSDYGESVGRASTWLLFFILFSFILGAIWPTSTAIETSTINQLANNALPYVPLGASPPKDIGIMRFLQIFWQVLITFQATLLGFALRNRYRR